MYSYCCSTAIDFLLLCYHSWQTLSAQQPAHMDVGHPHNRRRPGQQNAVFSRLQSLFPTSPHAHISAPSPRFGDVLDEKSVPSPTPRISPVDPKFMKIRIVTWNMHESLPKGDLEELLGKVPLYTTPSQSSSILQLPNDGNHPYHLVVIAGQECPTPSGIPMGLGAGFKILDNKDREKSREGEKEHDKGKDKTKDKDRVDEAQTEETAPENPTAGWTSMVEDWLCHGGGYTSRTNSPSTTDVGLPRPLMRHKSTKESRKGPYQLLIKERLMGIYLAIYVHRDVKPFVRGMSKSAVTAGLIGGRLGNKGGVGISLNIEGTTYLFLNAHLAAHGGRMNHRLANLSKIKAELDVDHYLQEDDPRMAAEDLTDQFDFTFLFGDLNFRLDISRLHADWLISRREYRQAFEFDQLNAIMKTGSFFDGFNEAPIDFPPTFKYDVLRTLKRPKRSSSKLSRAGDSSTKLAEVEERGFEENDDEGDEDEGASLMSSAMTSLNSKPATEPGNDEDAYFHASPSTPTAMASTSKVSLAPTGASKAKVKWLSILSPSFSPKLKTKHGEPWGAPGTPVTPNQLIPPSPLSAHPPISASDSSKRRFLRPPPMILVSSNSSGGQETLAEEEVVEEKGVYDSSHKKRVPSWCDRILWKTTIFPESVYEELESYELHHRPRPKVVQFLANAFKPSSPRARDTPQISTVLSSQSTETTPSTVNGPSPPLPHNISILESDDEPTPPFHHLLQPRFHSKGLLDALQVLRVLCLQNVRNQPPNRYGDRLFLHSFRQPTIKEAFHRQNLQNLQQFRCIRKAMLSVLAIILWMIGGCAGWKEGVTIDL
ncbi:unnamed protein product [Cyclocybe aegerita]|uniref:Inositol polyphosphate-related phosphatase domain-containing protein n=1 Tax=Cyclocybe aegerita TaxID=1973307 RepID=A0A8S0W0N6_CYCAE|nr:unnamed protein product [Cyclocybe aegerita]